jgi:hypothetical protein
MVMEATKRTYQKHTIGGKIAIKHFLYENKREDEYGQRYFIYVQITIKRKTTQFKSKVEFFGFSKDDFENENYDFYKDAIDRDKNLIEFLVTKLDPFNKDNFDIKEVTKLYNNYGLISLEGVFNTFLMYEISDFHKNRKIPAMVSPLSYLGFYQDSEPTLKIKASKFISKVWYLDILVYNLTQRHDSGYMSFQPTIHDFITGNFKNSLSKFKILDDKEIGELINEMTKLYDSYGAFYLT